MHSNVSRAASQRTAMSTEQPACPCVRHPPEVALGAPALGQEVDLHVWGGPHLLRLLRVQQLQLARSACTAGAQVEQHTQGVGNGCCTCQPDGQLIGGRPQGSGL